MSWAGKTETASGSRPASRTSGETAANSPQGSSVPLVMISSTTPAPVNRRQGGVTFEFILAVPEPEIDLADQPLARSSSNEVDDSSACTASSAGTPMPIAGHRPWLCRSSAEWIDWASPAARQGTSRQLTVGRPARISRLSASCRATGGAGDGHRFCRRRRTSCADPPFRRRRLPWCMLPRFPATNSCDSARMSRERASEDRWSRERARVSRDRPRAGPSPACRRSPRSDAAR